MKQGVARSLWRIVGFMLTLAVSLSLSPFAITEMSTGSISGMVWEDADVNGLRGENESPLSGVTVQILNQRDGSLIGSTTTDASGLYQFANLPSGYYTIIVIAPDRGLTFKNAVGGRNIDSDFGMGTGVIATNVRVQPGAFILHLDAGLFSPSSGSATAVVSGYVWRDTNHNGLIDAGEPMNPGVTLHGSTTGGQTARTTTWWDGYYEFDFASLTGNLGEASISIILPAHFKLTYFQIGTDSNGSVFSPTRLRTTLFALQPNSVMPGINAGLCRIPATPQPPVSGFTPTPTPTSEPDIPPGW